MIQEAIKKLIAKQNLTSKEAESVMNEIMSAKATNAQIGGFLVALRLKGETIDEITAFAKVMREKASTIKPKGLVVDTCGTGGDEAKTFNISTTAAFVVAGAGIKVAKHGNKSVSSSCGSADVLKELGINIELKPEKVEQCINEVGIGFMFAPLFHGAMKYAIGPRKELGIRTVFNVLGPLTNPANAQAQIVGVFDEKLTEPLAEVLGRLGSKHAFVVHGNGLDEITISGQTTVSEYKDGHVKTYKLNPVELGIKLASREELLGGTPEKCSQIIMDILQGKEKGPKRDIVLLNASAAIIAAGKADNFKDALKIAADSIGSGNALKKLEELKAWSNK